MTREIFAQSKIEIKNINLKKKYLYPVVSCALEYKFLGHRQYTHGSSMFEGMLKTIFRFEKKCKSKIIEFKVVKQFNQFSYTEAFEEKYIQNLEVIKDNFCRQYKSVIYNIEKDIQLGKKRFVIKKGKLISKNRIINFKICFFIQIP